MQNAHPDPSNPEQFAAYVEQQLAVIQQKAAEADASTKDIEHKTAALEAKIATQEAVLGKQRERYAELTTLRHETSGELQALSARLRETNERLVALERKAGLYSYRRDAALLGTGEAGAAFADEMAALGDEAKGLIEGRRAAAAATQAAGTAGEAEAEAEGEAAQEEEAMEEGP